MAGSFDGTTLRIYVDGAEVGTGTPNTGTIAYGLQFDDLELGNYLATDVCGYTYGFPGDLDQVSIYGKALTADEVAMLAKGDQPAPPALPGPPPVPKAPTPLPGRSLGPKVEGIEVTQATQTFDQPRSLTYTGVPLIKHKKTVVRVFADLVGPEAVGGPGARPPMGMALFATDGAGRALPGSPLFPEWAPSTATMSRGDDFLTEAERNSETSAFTFTLPDAWTLGTVNVEARALGSGLCIEAACGTTASRNALRRVVPRPAAGVRGEPPRAARGPPRGRRPERDRHRDQRRQAPTRADLPEAPRALAAELPLSSTSRTTRGLAALPGHALRQRTPRSGRRRTPTTRASAARAWPRSGCSRSAPTPA